MSSLHKKGMSTHKGIRASIPHPSGLATTCNNRSSECRRPHQPTEPLESTRRFADAAEHSLAELLDDDAVIGHPRCSL
eukprot:scaffold559624_cov32-Prasinocladus_malaysianus.AAC.1